MTGTNTDCLKFNKTKMVNAVLLVPGGGTKTGGVKQVFMRKVVTISMPDDMYEHLLRRLSRTRYASVSEYVRDLIRKDDPGHGEPGHWKAPAVKSQPEREPAFVIRTANEWLQEAGETPRAELTDL
jgi:Arc/MetJ-type ribon-helix-helix transcriptional regulator